MNDELATAKALQTGIRAMRLGVMLDNYEDPDTAQLAAECARVGIPAGTVFLDK